MRSYSEVFEYMGFLIHHVMVFPGPGRTVELYFLDPVEPAKLRFGTKNPGPPPVQSNAKNPGQNPGMPTMY